jgi:hypothetical protein
MKQKHVKLYNIVTAKLYDKQAWINREVKEYRGEPQQCIVVEINPESDHPYLVTEIYPKGCMAHDWWLTRDEILEVTISGFE